MYHKASVQAQDQSVVDFTCPTSLVLVRQPQQYVQGKYHVIRHCLALSVCARDVAPSLAAAVAMSRRFSRSKYLQSSVLVAVCLDGIENDNQYRGARQNNVKGMTATKGSSSSSRWLLPIQKKFCHQSGLQLWLTLCFN